MDTSVNVAYPTDSTGIIVYASPEKIYASVENPPMPMVSSSFLIIIIIIAIQSHYLFLFLSFLLFLCLYFDRECVEGQWC